MKCRQPTEPVTSPPPQGSKPPTPPAPDVSPVLGHLIVLRETTRAQLVNIDAAIAAVMADVPEAVPCEHDPEKDPLVSTMSEKSRRRCQACGEEYESEATW
jgi:hypothetical protein